MSSDYNDWTVARLKEELRERNLPISGKKSILIERLIENNQTSIEDKIEFDCKKCNSILRISANHQGRVKCPNCGEIQTISEKNEFAERVQDISKKIQASTQGLGRNHLAVGLSITGVVLLLISIILFFSAIGVSCPVEYMGTEIVNGQEYDTCTDANGNEMWIGEDDIDQVFGKIGFACGVLLPLSVTLAALGLFLRKDQQVQHQNDASIDANQDNTHTANIVDSQAMRIVQITSLGIVGGVGIIGTIIFVLILLAILALFILLLVVLFSGGANTW